MTMHGECSVKYLMKKANQHSKFKETYFFTKSYNLNGCDDFAHSINGYITNYKFTKKDIQVIFKVYIRLELELIDYCSVAVDGMIRPFVTFTK